MAANDVNDAQDKHWTETLTQFLQPSVITMLFLGFSAGIPILLIFSSLSLWLGEAGVERSAITYFSWAALGYSFKFLWAPLVDRLPVPFLTSMLGRRRSWLLVAQSGIVIAICSMALVDPAKSADHLTWMALAVVLLGFSAATQDIVIDAFRIESAPPDLQALLSSTYIAGYRIGMLVAGAGALLLASEFGSSKELYNYDAWRLTYFCMASTMLVGIVTAFVVKEPANQSKQTAHYTTGQYLRFLALFVLAIIVFINAFIFAVDAINIVKDSILQFTGNKPLSGLVGEAIRLKFAILCVVMFVFLLDKIGLVERQLVKETYIEAIRDFFKRYGLKVALLLLLFVGFYRISDIVLGVISNVFFQDMGYTKTEIATVVKSFGLGMTIVGGFVGGAMSIKYGVMRMLFIGAVLTVVTNLLFMLLASRGHDIYMLYVVISADNLAAGLASAAFIAFLSSLTNISFTAVQYAIFSSLMTLLPKVIGGYSGSIVENVGYSQFFLLASLMGVPVLLLIYWVKCHITLGSEGAMVSSESK